MLEILEYAIDNEEYDRAEKIIQESLKKDENNLWLRYYEALILEKKGILEEAEKKYRQILKDSVYPDPKLIKLIRDSLERIVQFNREKKETERQKKEIVIQELKNSENGEDLAVLILQPVTIEKKKELAISLAKIMDIDNYSAMLQIPTRSLKLYKTGNFGELNYYQSQLSTAGIPCFCQGVNKIASIKVYQVKHIINEEENQVNILCEDDEEIEKIVNLSWKDINNKIEAIIPIFEKTLHFDARGKVIKKPSILDYAKFFDLHLITKNLILRFSDYFYEFDQGLNITKEDKTAKEKWAKIVNFLNTKIVDKPLWSDFSLFAEGATHFPEMLKQINAHIQLFRREESLWDEAFQLYSGLIFLSSLDSQPMIDKQ